VDEYLNPCLADDPPNVSGQREEIDTHAYYASFGRAGGLSGSVHTDATGVPMVDAADQDAG
jgi:hypothetical protein